MTDLEQVTAPVVVRLPAEIDMVNAERVGEELCSAFARGAAVVIADLTSTVFCDCAGARQFVLAHNHAEAHDTEIRFAIPGRNMLRVLTLTGLDQMLSIYPSLDAAVSAGPAVTGPLAARRRAAPARYTPSRCSPMTGSSCTPTGDPPTGLPSGWTG